MAPTRGASVSSSVTRPRTNWASADAKPPPKKTSIHQKMRTVHHKAGRGALLLLSGCRRWARVANLAPWTE